MYNHLIPPSKAINKQGRNNMNAQKFAIATVATLAILFAVLLVLGVVFSSVLTIVASFVCGFIGYAIVEHEASVEYENSNNEGIK